MLSPVRDCEVAWVCSHPSETELCSNNVKCIVIILKHSFIFVSGDVYEDKCVGSLLCCGPVATRVRDD